MRIFLTGADGMLGAALIAALAQTPATASWPLCGVSLADFDIAEPGEAAAAVETFRPDVVVHAAACAIVDDCEADPGYAMRVNVAGTQHVADACRRYGARLVYVSSDYVFDGGSRPPGGYTEQDIPGPVNVYGLTKLAGERIACTVPDHLVLRTSWLFGGSDERTDNVLALVRAASRGEQAELIDDQFSCPTYTADLARAIIHLLAAAQPVTGTVHVTNAGSASWHQVGEAVLAALAELRGAPGGLTPPRPVALADCGFLGARPADSSLSTGRLARLGYAPPDWQDAVRRYCALLTMDGQRGADPAHDAPARGDQARGDQAERTAHV